MRTELEQKVQLPKLFAEAAARSSLAEKYGAFNALFNSGNLHYRIHVPFDCKSIVPNKPMLDKGIKK